MFSASKTSQRRGYAEAVRNLCRAPAKSTSNRSRFCLGSRLYIGTLSGSAAGTAQASGCCAASMLAPGVLSPAVSICQPCAATPAILCRERWVFGRSHWTTSSTSPTATGHYIGLAFDQCITSNLRLAQVLTQFFQYMKKNALTGNGPKMLSAVRHPYGWRLHVGGGDVGDISLPCVTRQLRGFSDRHNG